MTSTQLATTVGASVGVVLSVVAYSFVPFYHNVVVWSWGLVGINLEAIFS